MLKWAPGYKPEPEVNFHGYCTSRGDAMLDILINGERQYRLGPFTNKEQRRVLVEELRDVLHTKATPRDRR